MPANYLLPPRLIDQTGQTRRAGFEFEFGNLPIGEAARALHSSMGGELENISPFEALLHDSKVGKLRVERDANLLKSTRYRKWLETLGVEFTPGTLAHEIETNIDSASRVLIPCEVVTQPIPLAELNDLDTLVQALNELGAEGTQDSVIYAFGLHINASLPSTESVNILRHLQSFLLLHAWLVETAGTDLTRRYLTPYIDPFPQDYMEKVLDVAYRPAIDQLIDDYLEFNPTRNRALDMLPIFCELDRDRVMAGLPAEERKLVNARPAFHYRLPDCKVNVPGWSVASAWNHWVFIEKLADDDRLMNRLIDAWQTHYADFKLVQNTRWVMQLTTLIAEQYFTDK
ncbi:amidoligase family protein [Pseudohalioglobus lutimaris]|uniref:Amidoligase enzyme n=1 Tax=Pseudohalioglobus lutimaris TaxID=1737061 RepID=A0A2N5X3G6_9GAMM|nr:amidoligase family protein [Pseudohalioglobus lutimaris]PLW69018.1 amidoligase enzyme [Pseudohalioglobus lutimaris]